MNYMDLISAFDREVEVLELTKDYMVYALDQKNEIKDLCAIEMMDLKSGEISTKLVLDYTRLWESFRTYSQMPDFFYAVNVLQDYRVRLRRVRKDIWENDADILIVPEGEIINMYSLNEDFMIITDEVKADESILEKYQMAANGHRYVNVRYLYEFKTGKKYPIKDRYFDSLTEDIPVRLMGGVPTLIHEVFYCDEEAERSQENTSCILAVPVDAFIAHIKADGMAGFKVIAGGMHTGGDGGFSYVRRLDVRDDQVILRRRNIAEGREQIVALNWEQDGFAPESILGDYKVAADSRLFYDLYTMDVFACSTDEEAEQKTVTCLTRDGASVVYDGKYGDFARMIGDLMVTTYFDEVFVREYEYHEFTAIHHLKDGTVDTIEGRAEYAPDTLVLLRSFLAL